MKTLTLYSFIVAICLALSILSSCKKGDDIPAPKVTESVVKYQGDMVYKNDKTQDRFTSTFTVDSNIMYDFTYKGSIDTIYPTGTDWYIKGFSTEGESHIEMDGSRTVKLKMQLNWGFAEYNFNGRIIN